MQQPDSQTWHSCSHFHVLSFIGQIKDYSLAIISDAPASANILHDKVIFLRGNPVSDDGGRPRPSFRAMLLFYPDSVATLPPNKRIENDLIVVHFHHIMFQAIVDMLRNSTVHPKQKRTLSRFIGRWLNNFRKEKPVGFDYDTENHFAQLYTGYEPPSTCKGKSQFLRIDECQFLKLVPS